MEMLDKFRPSENLQENVEAQNIYDEIGVTEPFTILVGEQFNSFIAELSENKHGLLNGAEKKAFEILWQVACIDMGGFGNNIWNLENGSFEIYNSDGIIVRFEKKNSEVKSRYGTDEGRANFIYLSKDGSFIIRQNDRNKRVFLVYTSVDITDRLLESLRISESEALDIEIKNLIDNTKSK